MKQQIRPQRTRIRWTSRKWRRRGSQGSREQSTAAGAQGHGRRASRDRRSLPDSPGGASLPQKVPVDPGSHRGSSGSGGLFFKAEGGAGPQGLPFRRGSDPDSLSEGNGGRRGLVKEERELGLLSGINEELEIPRAKSFIYRQTFAPESQERPLRIPPDGPGPMAEGAEAAQEGRWGTNLLI